MAKPKGYKRWVVNLLLIVLSTVLFVAALLSAVATPNTVTWVFVLVFGGFLVLYLRIFIKELDK